jgi:uncharacterized protein (DUF305 family)
MRNRTRINWTSALVLGLFSSTFSTIVSQLAAGLIGRDAYVDWMEVAAIPFRNGAMALEPTRAIIAGGIAFHQCADISWALFFFGALGAWTARLSPSALVLVAAPWALFTSFLEWSFLVPVFPFFQPTFTLRQPYWIGFSVHLASASIYLFFPLLRGWISGSGLRWTIFLKIWAVLAVVGPLTLAALALASASGREIPHVGGEETFDASYMQRMSAHHRQGMELAQLAAIRAQDDDLRSRARLMYAGQHGEIGVMERWLGSWFGAAPMSHAHEAMPGMIDEDEIARLRAAEGRDFDARFVELMSRHHAGAITMAQEAMRLGGDPRIVIFSQGVAHQQCGDIALMHGLEGTRAVGFALRSFWLSLRERIVPARDCGA